MSHFSNYLVVNVWLPKPRIYWAEHSYIMFSAGQLLFTAHRRTNSLLAPSLLMEMLERGNLITRRILSGPPTSQNQPIRTARTNSLIPSPGCEEPGQILGSLGHMLTVHMENCAGYTWTISSSFSRGKNGRGHFFVDKIQRQLAVYPGPAEYPRIALGSHNGGDGGDDRRRKEGRASTYYTFTTCYSYALHYLILITTLWARPCYHFLLQMKITTENLTHLPTSHDFDFIFMPTLVGQYHNLHFWQIHRSEELLMSSLLSQSLSASYVSSPVLNPVAMPANTMDKISCLVKHEFSQLLLIERMETQSWCPEACNNTNLEIGQSLGLEKRLNRCLCWDSLPNQILRQGLVDR